MDNEGRNSLVTFYPKTDSASAPVGRGWKGTVVVALPDTVGGVEPGNYATFTVVFPYIGKPGPVDAAGLPIVTTPSILEAAESETDREPVPA
jgi:hypothetical protein